MNNNRLPITPTVKLSEPARPASRPVGIGNRPVGRAPRFDNQKVVRSTGNTGYRFGDFGRFGN